MTLTEFFRQRLRPRPRPVLLKPGDTFLFLGRQLQLSCVITLHKKSFFSVPFHEGQLLLHIPQEQWSDPHRHEGYPWMDRLVQFYEKEGRAWIHRRTLHWAEQMKLFPTKIKFRAPRTRWGSCSSQGSINFNWKLIVFDPSVIDYVVIHELAHLQHLNHSRSFWDLVKFHCPDYKIYEKILKTQQSDPQFLKT